MWGGPPNRRLIMPRTSHTPPLVMDEIGASVKTFLQRSLQVARCWCRLEGQLRTRKSALKPSWTQHILRLCVVGTQQLTPKEVIYG